MVATHVLNGFPVSLEAQSPHGRLESYGVGLLTEPTPDGPDFHRLCDLHVWASLPAATAESTGHCPWCALAFDNRRGLQRYRLLKARMEHRA